MAKRSEGRNLSSFLVGLVPGAHIHTVIGVFQGNLETNDQCKFGADVITIWNNFW